MRILEVRSLKAFILLSFCIMMVSDMWASSVKREYFDNPIQTRTFDDEAWKNAIGEIDYTPEAVRKKQEEEANNPTNTGTNNTGNTGGGRDFSPWNWNVGSGTAAWFFKLLLIIAIIIILALIIYKMAGGSSLAPVIKKDNKGVLSGEVNIEQVEQNLHKSDMEILIEKAMKENNYMMAVRLYYLWIIKELSNGRFIKWKRDKTNRDYIRELRKTDFHKPFRNATRIFERVWYGNRNELKNDDFQPIRKEFQSLVDSIRKK